MSLGYPELDEEEQLEDDGELESLRAAFIGCFTSPHGETVLAKLYDYCDVGRPTFVPGQPDLTAFNEGKRKVMLFIMGLMQMDDEELFRQTRRVTRGH